MQKKAAVKGMSLIELMVVVAIVGIIAAVGYPSYQEHVFRTKRAAAQADLLTIAQSLERYFTANFTYVGFNLAQTTSPATGDAQYQINFAQAPTAEGYRLQAVPIGGQSKDACGTLWLDRNNNRGAAKEGCW